MNETINTLTEFIHQVLNNKVTGKCYVASEALYHLAGGKVMGFIPQVMKVGDITHWYLRHDGNVIDITAAQFSFELDYSTGVGKGFLTKKPSKKAQKIIDGVLKLMQ